MIQISQTTKSVFRATVAAATTALLFAFTSCASSVTIQAKKDCSADITMAADIGTSVYNTIKSVTAGISQVSDANSLTDEAPASPSQKNVSLFSADEIKQALSAGDITNISVSTPSVSSLTVKGTLPAPANQKAVLDNKGLKLANFVTCTNNSLTVILSPATIRDLAASLPEESKSYLDLLMAPVFTGEQMSASEYEDLVAAVYGDDMKQELASGSVKITLVTPAGVMLKKSSIGDGKNVKTSSDRAVFTVPLTEFLTLQSAQTFSISW